jgi:hypothetical protein
MIRNFKRHINFQRTQKMFIITHEFKKVIYEHSSFFFFFFYFNRKKGETLLGRSRKKNFHLLLNELTSKYLCNTSSYCRE